MGVLVAVTFFFSDIPEVSEAELQATAEAKALADGQAHADQLALPFWRQYRAIGGAIAQFLYVGAQVTIGSFFLNYTYENADIPDARGSQLLSYALITFTVGRFVGTALLAVISAPVLLFAYSVLAGGLTILVGSVHGMAGVVCLIMVMFFESIMYPVIFVLGTANLGRHTRRASALLVMGVSGGAVFPPIQGAIAESHGTRISYFIAVPCFVYIALWAAYIWSIDGRKILADSAEETGSAGEKEVLATEKV
ncbi:hypothetical protein HDU93_000423 [Gonapodya sp. JEL0774]|nr:hypothetical protein HDU93_000423 [Gonapodya sp. JEL0774]